MYGGSQDELLFYRCFNYLNVLLPILILLPTLYLISVYKKQNIVLYDDHLFHNKSRYEFESTDIELIRSILIKKSINLNEVYEIYNVPNACERSD